MDAAGDPELLLKAALALAPPVRPDIGRITGLLQDMQRQLAALEGFTLAAARSNTLDATLHHGASAVLAAEAATALIVAVMRELGTARSSVAAIEDAARLALGEAMHATGCQIFPLEHHNLEAAAGAQRVEIEQPDRLPAAYWRDAEPAPDKNKLAAALKLGPVPGARLARGPHTIRITAKRASR